MSEQRFSLLVPGNYSCNFIFGDLPDFPELGKELYAHNFVLTPGGVLNTVVALDRLEVDVKWMGKVGRDFFSRYVMEVLKSEEVDTSMVEQQDGPLRIVTMALTYPKDRALVSFADQLPDPVGMLQEHADDESYNAVYFSQLLLDERMPELLQHLKDRGVLITSDCHSMQESLENPLVEEIVSKFDLFFPNAAEVKQLTGKESISDGAKILAEKVPYLVVKDGKKGAHAWREDEHYYRAPLKVDPVDTTGAGDVFNAGFLAAYFSGHDTPTCLHWGVIAGGFATRGYGGTPAAPTLEELQNYLAKHPKS
jgi:sugar/nucleoside kinase (ribokinase family)